MPSIEQRLQALENATSPPLDEARIAAAARMLNGTATIDDYEQYMPGLLRLTADMILTEALSARLRRYEQFVDLIPHDDYLDTPWEQRLAECEYDARVFGPAWSDTIMPMLWLERFDGFDGPELAAIAEHCSYFESEIPPPHHHEQVVAADHSSDLHAKRRAHLYLAATSGGYAVDISHGVEEHLAEWFLDSQGKEGRGERHARHRGAGCRGTKFDCHHDRLAATCYDRATAAGCPCHDRPTTHRYDYEHEDPDSTAKELAYINQTLGARAPMPDHTHVVRALSRPGSRAVRVSGFPP